jgi:hypothetical protein
MRMARDAQATPLGGKDYYGVARAQQTSGNEARLADARASEASRRTSRRRRHASDIGMGNPSTSGTISVWRLARSENKPRVVEVGIKARRRRERQKQRKDGGGARCGRGGVRPNAGRWQREGMGAAHCSDRGGPAPAAASRHADFELAATGLAVAQGLYRFVQARLVVGVHHDLRTAAEWFDRVALVDRRVVAAGRTSDTLTPENLQRTYAGHVDVLDDLAQAIAARGRTP